MLDRKMETAFYDTLLQVYTKLELDIIYAYESLPDGYKLKQLPNGQLIDQIGRVFAYDKISKLYTPVGTIFNTPDDVKTFLDQHFPDPTTSGRDFGVKYLSKINQDMAAGIFIREPFAHVWEALTPVKFVSWMYSNPSIVSRFIEKVTEFNISLIDTYGEEDSIDLIVMGGDLCDVKGPMLPPEQFRKLKVYEAMRNHVEAAHKYSIKFIKHTDGNINPILEDLVNIAQIDGLHSLDPSAGVNIKEVKERYGDKLILHGNVSVDNLATKSITEIVEETKTVIRAASPGGGHILSSSNSWYGGVKLENCYAMVETGRKYGKYPIQI
jgi:hypothetical protein